MDEISPTVLEKPKHRNQHPPAVTKAKQTEYLKALIETCSHGLACRAVSIGDTAPFHWASKNEDFRKRLEAARAQMEQILLARYESSLDDTVLTNTDFEQVCKSQILRMFRMKRLDPRYRDNAPTNVNLAGPVAIQLNLSVQAHDASGGASTP